MNIKTFRVNEPKVVHDSIDGEVILIHMDTGNYYSIDSVGADIWDLICTNMTVQQMVDDLMLRYEGENSDIVESVNNFVSQLEDEGLIVVDDGSASLSSKTDSSSSKSMSPTKLSFTAPTLEVFSDMQDLLLLDPIHEVDEKGWPHESKE